jgi:hypothetical protein
VFEQLRLKSIVEGGSVTPKAPPFEAIGEHLVATLAYAWPQSVQVIGDEDLSKWGVSFYEAMEVARENLQESTVAYAKIGDGLYSFMSGDSYDASRITLVHEAKGLEVKGSLVAMVPNRDLLLITGSEEEAGLAIMAAMAEKGLEQPYSLSAVPLIWEDDEWKDWMPSESGPLRGTFKQMEIKWLGPLCHEQKELRDAVHDKQGTTSSSRVIRRSGSTVNPDRCSDLLAPRTQLGTAKRLDAKPILRRSRPFSARRLTWSIGSVLSWSMMMSIAIASSSRDWPFRDVALRAKTLA